MVLITGTNLDVSQLPHNDMIEYQIENVRMNIKLKTVAKSPTCFQIYIAEDKRTEYTITDELVGKIVYFKDDDDLLKKLDVGETSIEKDIFDDTPIPEPVIETPPDFSDIKKEAEEEQKKKEEEQKKIEEQEKVKEEQKEEKKEDSKKAKKESKKEKVSVSLDKKEDIPENEKEENRNIENSIIPTLDLEEAVTDLPETMLQIPNLGDDIDSLRELLNNKDRIIAQKDGMIKELRQSVDDTYKAQEIQLTEVETMWTQKLAEAQSVIKELEGKISGVSLDTEMTNFLKFINYAQKNKAVVKEGFTEEDKIQIGRLSSDYTLFACGSGESNYSMLKQVRKYMDYSPDCVILDFTNDIFLSTSLKVNLKDTNTMDLLKDEINPISLLRDINGTKLIPTTSYNDIALLNIDWVKLLRKIDDLASGKPVILIFGNINNFNVRYTVSKLASLMKLYVFVKCSPIILTVLYGDIQFIPKSRVNIVALDYIDIVKNILSALAKSFNVLAFSSEIEWGKLGLKK